MASSVASATAENRRESESSFSRITWRWRKSGVPGGGFWMDCEGERPSRFAVEKAMTKSPEPLEPEAPVRAKPRMARAARRRSWR